VLGVYSEGWIEFTVERVELTQWQRTFWAEI